MLCRCFALKFCKNQLNLIDFSTGCIQAVCLSVRVCAANKFSMLCVRVSLCLQQAHSDPTTHSLSLSLSLCVCLSLYAANK